MALHIFLSVVVFSMVFVFTIQPTHCSAIHLHRSSDELHSLVSRVHTFISRKRYTTSTKLNHSHFFRIANLRRKFHLENFFQQLPWECLPKYFSVRYTQLRASLRKLGVHHFTPSYGLNRTFQNILISKKSFNVIFTGRKFSYSLKYGPDLDKPQNVCKS